jgi:hypothetical protein
MHAAAVGVLFVLSARYLPLGGKFTDDDVSVKGGGVGGGGGVRGGGGGGGGGKGGGGVSGGGGGGGETGGLKGGDASDAGDAGGDDKAAWSNTPMRKEQYGGETEGIPPHLSPRLQNTIPDAH